MTVAIRTSSPPVRARLRRRGSWQQVPADYLVGSLALAPVVDAVAIGGASLALVATAAGDAARTGPLPWLLAFDVVTIALLHLRGLYRFRLRSSLLDDIGATVVCTVLAVAAVITARSLVAPDVHIATQTMHAWAFVAPNLLVVRTVRSFADRRHFRRGGTSNTLIIGAGTIGGQVAQRLLERPEMGLRPVGFLDKDALLPTPAASALPVLGASWDFEDQVALHGVTTVVFTFSTAPHQVYLDLIRRSHALGLRVLLVPRLFEQMTGRVELAHVGGLALLQVSPVPVASRRFEVKYLIERVVAGLALVLIAPMMAMLALAVRRSSPGPVLFRQRRVGLNGREFDMLKFRTMTGSPETHGEADAAWSARIVGNGASTLTQAVEAPVVVDRRTPLGRFLRKASLDELPQLINVVRGEMSLVGPRPERVALARCFEQSIPRYSERHRVKPGMTGWAQVQGLRGDTSLRDRVEWDNHYIENWTPWFDLKVLLLTASAVFSARHSS
jgi:exopolysaccharide biosynthesis polyprenyl glycosylphosphotransferase